MPTSAQLPTGSALALLIAAFTGLPCLANDYPIVDTNLAQCYDDLGEEINPPPVPGQPFYGQDAQHDGIQPALLDNGDGTVTDLNTGLMWAQHPGPERLSLADAVTDVDMLTIGGHDDWRLPTLEELYSITDFSVGWPFIDLTYFVCELDPHAPGSTQYWSSTEYVGLAEGQVAAFGVNFATGHIKAYEQVMRNYVRPVRGDSYGESSFVDNGDGTVTDLATGLMWQQMDNGVGLDWEAALAYAENLDLAGHQDWRLPDAKELQSIVDYTHSPNAIDPADLGPAIDTDFFDVTELASGTTNYQPDYGYYWTSTSTVGEPPDPGHYWAWYVAIGIAVNDLGLDSHGAGAVRFDTKVEGGPAAEDSERIYNFVLCVRDAACGDKTAVYCTAKTTSSGCIPSMSFDGVPSASASSGFVIIAEQVEANRPGLLVYSTTGPDALPYAGGLLCIQTPLIYALAQNSGSRGALPCPGILSVDLNELGICASIGEGNQGWIQGWFRDPNASYGMGLTDAVRFTVCP